MPWHVHRIHATFARRFRRLTQALPVILAHSRRIWCFITRLVEYTCDIDAQEHPTVACEGHQRIDDV